MQKCRLLLIKEMVTRESYFQKELDTEYKDVLDSVEGSMLTDRSTVPSSMEICPPSFFYLLSITRMLNEWTLHQSSVNQNSNFVP